MSSALPDGRLLRLTARGDSEAFRELFERKHRRVFLIAQRILGDAGASEDVVQETFLALWEHADRYRPRFLLDPWLTRIATNKALDRYRSERRHPDPIGERPDGAGDSDRSPARQLAATGELSDSSLPARRGEIARLWETLAADLPAQQRAAFVLRVIEGHPPAEVAAALGCSRSAVRTHVMLARKKLRAAIEERHPELLADRRQHGRD